MARYTQRFICLTSIGPDNLDLSILFMNKPIFIDDETAKIACKLNLNKKTIIIDKIFIQSTMNLLFIMNNKPKMAYSHDLAIMNVFHG